MAVNVDRTCVALGCNCKIQSFNRYLTDYSTGFGGKYGVQTDRKDKSAVGWEHQEQTAKHESQKGRQPIFPQLYINGLNGRQFEVSQTLSLPHVMMHIGLLKDTCIWAHVHKDT